MKINARRVLGFGLGIFALLAVAVAINLTRSEFRSEGFFQFRGQLRPDLRSHKWLPDCDGDGYPDLAAIFRDPGKPSTRIPDSLWPKREISLIAKLYSGKTGRVICRYRISPARGKINEIIGYDGLSNQLLLNLPFDGRSWLYKGPARVREAAYSGAQVQRFRTYLKGRAVELAQTLGVSSLDSLVHKIVGTCFDPESNQQVIVVRVIAQDPPMCTVLLCDATDASVIKSLAIVPLDLESVGVDPSRVSSLHVEHVADLDDDGTLDISMVYRGEHFHVPSSDFVHFDLNGSDLMLESGRETGRTGWRHIERFSGFANLDRRYIPRGRPGPYTHLIFEPSTNSSETSARYSLECPHTYYCEVMETEDFNNDGIGELSIHCQAGYDAPGDNCIRLLDGATFKPLTQISPAE